MTSGELSPETPHTLWPSSYQRRTLSNRATEDLSKLFKMHIKWQKPLLRMSLDIPEHSGVWEHSEALSRGILKGFPSTGPVGSFTLKPLLLPAWKESDWTRRISVYTSWTLFLVKKPRALEYFVSPLKSFPLLTQGQFCMTLSLTWVKS